MLYATVVLRAFQRACGRWARGTQRVPLEAAAIALICRFFRAVNVALPCLTFVLGSPVMVKFPRASVVGLSSRVVLLLSGLDIVSTDKVIVDGSSAAISASVPIGAERFGLPKSR